VCCGVIFEDFQSVYKNEHNLIILFAVVFLNAVSTTNVKGKPKNVEKQMPCSSLIRLK